MKSVDNSIIVDAPKIDKYLLLKLLVNEHGKEIYNNNK